MCFPIPALERNCLEFSNMAFRGPIPSQETLSTAVTCGLHGCVGSLGLRLASGFLIQQHGLPFGPSLEGKCLADDEPGSILSMDSICSRSRSRDAIHKGQPRIPSDRLPKENWSWKVRGAARTLAQGTCHLPCVPAPEAGSLRFTAMDTKAARVRETCLESQGN